MHILNKPVIHALLIILAVCLSYSNTLDAPFEFDDLVNIVENPAVRELSFSSGAGFEKNGQIAERVKPILRTRSVGYFTFALNFRAHGLDVRGYHLVNILIHLSASLLLYGLIRLTFSTPFFAAQAGKADALSEGSRGFIALFAALIFAAHPIQTQAVTYIVQRFASLAAMLYLLTLVLYLRFRLSIQASDSEARPRWFKARVWSLYASALLSAILAMKTKEFAFTLPAMMVLYEILFLTGTKKQRSLYLVPFALAMLIIPLSLAGEGGGIGDTYEAAAKASGATGNISRESYLFTQFRVIVTYLRLLVFPVNQNLDYDYPIYTSFFVPEVVFSFLLLLSLFALGIILYRLSRDMNREARPWFRLMSFGIFWFFQTISAESSIIPIADVIFEHRLYLPSAGFFIAFVSAADLAGARWGASMASARKTLVCAMVLAVSVLSVAAYARNAVWKDELTLFTDAAVKSPNKARTNYNLGRFLVALRRPAEALPALQRTLTLDPGHVRAKSSMAIAFYDLGMLAEAEQKYNEIIYYHPRSREAAFARSMLASIREELKKR